MAVKETNALCEAVAEVGLAVVEGTIQWFPAKDAFKMMHKHEHIMYAPSLGLRRGFEGQGVHRSDA